MFPLSNPGYTNAKLCNRILSMAACHRVIISIRSKQGDAASEGTIAAFIDQTKCLLASPSKTMLSSCSQSCNLHFWLMEPEARSTASKYLLSGKEYMIHPQSWQNSCPSRCCVFLLLIKAKSLAYRGRGAWAAYSLHRMDAASWSLCQRPGLPSLR